MDGGHPAFIREAFEHFDADGSGLLDSQELPDALDRCAVYLDEGMARKIVGSYGRRREQGLSLDEFAVLVTDLSDGLHHAVAVPKPSAPGASRLTTNKKGVPSHVAAAFKRYDADKSGSLDTEELPQALLDCGFNLHPNKAAYIVSLYDDSPDGALDIDEFARIVADMKIGKVRSPKDARQSSGGANALTPAAGMPASRKPRSYALRQLARESSPRRTKSAGTGRLDKAVYEPLSALERLEAMANEALYNAKSEHVLAEDAHQRAKTLWKERLNYRGALSDAHRFAAPGRMRLVQQAEELYWRTRAQVSQKQSFVARAKRDLHEAESMLARARKDAQMTETELQAQEASFGRRGESRAADAQAAVDGAAAAMRWKVVHDSMAATSVLSAALGSNNVTFVPPPVEIE